MSFKDILVHLDTSPRSATRLGVAVGLAVRHDAHLIGISIADIPSADLFRGSTMALLPNSPEEVVQQLRDDAAAAIEPVKAMFQERLRQAGLIGEWRETEGNRAAMLATHARYADLTIVGQPNRFESHDSAEDAMVASTLMQSGRPILAVPFAGDFPTLGERILVGWNASREAARAVHDALPLLATAKVVTVLAINPRHGLGGHGDMAVADIAAHLARHNITVEAAHTVAKDIADGEVLLSYAADIGADLIVAGAYGHSRVREMVFGGVTRTLLSEMTAPVLLSH
jgi:nucleotide-binding universal stress UspA family protein